MEKQAVIVFLRVPEQGKVKTRLSRDMDESFVLDLYKGFILDTLVELDSFPDKLIYFSPPEKGARLSRWLKNQYPCFAQEGKDLGQKMANAFQGGFSMGYDRLVLIGTDIPELNRDILIKAFAALQSADAVIGPARDGGYYLIGFRKTGFSEAIFQDINWSAPDVLEKTLGAMDRAHLFCERLCELSDIDTPADLEALMSRMKNGGKTGKHTQKCLEYHGR